MAKQPTKGWRELLAEKVPWGKLTSQQVFSIATYAALGLLLWIVVNAKNGSMELSIGAFGVAAFLVVLMWFIAKK